MTNIFPLVFPDHSCCRLLSCKLLLLLRCSCQNYAAGCLAQEVIESSVECRNVGPFNQNCSFACSCGHIPLVAASAGLNSDGTCRHSPLLLRRE